MPSPINVSAGSQAIIALGNVAGQADITGASNAMVLLTYKTLQSTIVLVCLDGKL